MMIVDHLSVELSTIHLRLTHMITLFVVCMCFITSAKASKNDKLPAQKYCGNITIYGNDIESEFKKLRHCRIIEGQLRIQRCTLPKGANLPYLSQVTEYIILERVEGLRSLAALFPRLSVIRGLRLFYDHFSLIIQANRHLIEVGPWSLKVIARGAVYVEDNILFCTDEESQWENLTVSEYQIENVFRNNRQECLFTGCEERGTCRARPNSCLATSLSCPIGNDEVCHGECLAGCTVPKSSSDCIACRNWEQDGDCVKKCPPTHLKFMNYRCVTASYCHNNGWYSYNPTDINEQPQQNSMSTSVPNRSHLECVKECPDYLIPKNTTCQIKLVCGSANLTNTNLGDNLRLCERIDGYLNIRISGVSAAKKLHENLGRLEVITGYLTVIGSNSLYSLTFLRNLHKIEGKETFYATDSHQGYSLFIYDNWNLRELWNWESRSKSFRLNGLINIRYNEHLCETEIKKLANMANISMMQIEKRFNGKKSAL